jgi:1-pyrroline-5-carboxylate dehydrogenase
MHVPDVEKFFIKLIQSVAPQSYIQPKAEVAVTRTFLSNFSGDQAGFLCRSFNVADAKHRL